MKKYSTFLIFSLLASTTVLKAKPFNLETADLETKQSKSAKLKIKLTTIKSRELRQNLEERINIIERSIGSALSAEDLSEFNTLQRQKKAHLENLRLDEETGVPQGFKIKEDLLGNMQWSFGAAGATLTPTLDGKKLVTNATKSMQLTKNFTTDKAQKVRIPFNIVVTKGEVSMSLYETGKLVPVQSKSLRQGEQPNGVLEFDAPESQMLTVVVSNELGDQASECTLKDLKILLEEEPRAPQKFKIKEDLLGNMQWSFGAPGATLNPMLDGKKLVTNTTKSIQLTKNFTTDKAQKVQIPFSIEVTKGEVSVSLYETGKLVPIQRKSLRQGEQPNGVLEFDAPESQMLTVVVSNENDGQTSECTLKDLKVLLEEEPRAPQKFKIKEDLLGNMQWSFGAAGATLTPTLDGKKLVTNTAKSIQLTKNFTTDKTQKVQIPFSIVVTKGEVSVSLYETGKLVPIQSKSLRAGDQPNGVLEFDASEFQMLTVVVSNELDGQASECTLKDLKILLGDKKTTLYGGISSLSMLLASDEATERTIKVPLKDLGRCEFVEWGTNRIKVISRNDSNNFSSGLLGSDPATMKSGETVEIPYDIDIASGAPLLFGLINSHGEGWLNHVHLEAGKHHEGILKLLVPEGITTTRLMFFKTTPGPLDFTGQLTFRLNAIDMQVNTKFKPIDHFSESSKFNGSETFKIKVNKILELFTMCPPDADKASCFKIGEHLFTFFQHYRTIVKEGGGVIWKNIDSHRLELLDPEAEITFEKGSVVGEFSATFQVTTSGPRDPKFSKDINPIGSNPYPCYFRDCHWKELDKNYRRNLFQVYRYRTLPVGDTISSHKTMHSAFYSK